MTGRAEPGSFGDKDTQLARTDLGVTPSGARRKKIVMVTTRNRVPAKTTGRQRLTVVLLLGTGFMLSADFSIMNVALPKLGGGVGLRVSELPWVVSAYALPAAGFTLLFGRIADLFGRRRIFLTGMALLTASSLAGGFATSAGLLLTARTLQGFATAIASPAAMSLLITSFSDDRPRARILGLNGTLLVSGFTVGALAGGTLVGLLSWRWAFLINVPVAAGILVATPFLVPPSRAPAHVKLDVPGAVTVTAGLLAFAFGVINRNLYALLGGLALLMLFWLTERRAKAPLAAASILSGPRSSGATPAAWSPCRWRAGSSS